MGHTPNTCGNYAAWQRHFGRPLTEQGLEGPPVAQITTNLVRRYSYWMSNRGMRPCTIRSTLYAPRARFAFLQEMGLVPGNPAREDRPPKKDAATRLLVSDEELPQVLKTAGRQRNTFRCVRDQAVLSVLIYCELRHREMLDLQVEPVNLTECALLGEAVPRSTEPRRAYPVPYVPAREQVRYLRWRKWKAGST